MRNSCAPFDFSPVLKPEGFLCACGKIHRAGIRLLTVGPGVLSLLPDELKSLGFSRPMIVADENTFRAAGENVCQLLEEQQIPYTKYVFPSAAAPQEASDILPAKLQPDEAAVGAVISAFDPSCDLILAVGSGTVGDICKAAATQLGIPQITVGTAPSMDGYTSASSSLELHHTKASVPENAPIGVVCDTKIMASAPLRLIRAGIGDVLAKVHSLTEWQIAALVRGEPYCAPTAALVRQAYERVEAAMESAVQREEAGIHAVIEGLLLSGICMTLVGTSRPASGQEHYFSHCWEMMAIARGEEYDLHGIYVGVGTLLSLRILEKLATIRPTLAKAEAAADRFDEDAWAARLRRVFPGTAEALIELEKKTLKNERTRRMERVRKILSVWDELVRLIRENLPDIDVLEAKMRAAGMPTKPADIGLSALDAADAFVCSRDTRDKYLTGSLIWDLGYMDEFEAWLKGIL